MKRVLPFVIVAIMAVLTSWGMSQGFRCFPGRLAWFSSGNRVPMPLTQQQPFVPAFQYPPGVAPTMSNMPLPTVNPSFDVDITPQGIDLSFPIPFTAPPPLPTLAPAPNLTVSGNVVGNASSATQNRPGRLLELTPPVQSPPLRFQPTPVFSPPQGTAAGRFGFMSRKHNTPFVTPEIIIEEVPEEPMVTTPTQASTSPPLQIVGPRTQSEPLDNIAVESDPFVADNAPVVVVTPDATGDDADNSDPFGNTIDDEPAEDDAPVVAPTSEVDEDDLDPFSDEF